MGKIAMVPAARRQREGCGGDCSNCIITDNFLKTNSGKSILSKREAL